MALIKCPECGKEISDTIVACPNCGYSFKKKNKWLLPVIIVLIVALIGGALSYFLYFKPNSVLDQAENLIAREKYSEADVLLASIPSSPRKEKILAQICIAEAKEAIASGNYALAEEKMKAVSSDSIPKELFDEINKQKADALLGQGRYTEADQYYASLEQTDDVIQLRKDLFYESRILYCALQTKDTLIFPESMTLKEAVCLYGGTEKNESESTEEIEVREYRQPEILLHYQAKTRGGSVTDGFQRYSWNMKTQSYSQNVSVDSLSTDKTTPSYVEYLDASEQLEYYEKQREISLINLSLMLGFDASLDDNQLKRVNAAIQGTSSTNIEMIPNNEIVPLPTPEKVQITPKP